MKIYAFGGQRVGGAAHFGESRLAAVRATGGGEGLQMVQQSAAEQAQKLLEKAQAVGGSLSAAERLELRRLVGRADSATLRRQAALALQTPTDVDNAFSALFTIGNDSAAQKALAAVSLSSVAAKLNKLGTNQAQQRRAGFSALADMLANMPDEYLRAELTPEVLDMFPSGLRGAAEDALCRATAALGKQPAEAAERNIADSSLVAAQFSGNGSAEQAPVGSSAAEKKRHQTMLAAVARLGNVGLTQKATSLLRAQERSSSDAAKREAFQRLMIDVSAEIDANIRRATTAGAQEMLQNLGELHEVLGAFIAATRNALPKSSPFRQFLQEVYLRRLGLCRAYLEGILSTSSEEQRLKRMHEVEKNHFREKDRTQKPSLRRMFVVSAATDRLRIFVEKQVAAGRALSAAQLTKQFGLLPETAQKLANSGVFSLKLLSRDLSGEGLFLSLAFMRAGNNEKQATAEAAQCKKDPQMSQYASGGAGLLMLSRAGDEVAALSTDVLSNAGDLAFPPETAEIEQAKETLLAMAASMHRVLRAKGAQVAQVVADLRDAAGDGSFGNGGSDIALEGQALLRDAEGFARLMEMLGGGEAALRQRLNNIEAQDFSVVQNALYSLKNSSGAAPAIEKFLRQSQGFLLRTSCAALAGSGAVTPELLSRLSRIQNKNNKPLIRLEKGLQTKARVEQKRTSFVFVLPAETWNKAQQGDAAALKEIEISLRHEMFHVVDEEANLSKDLAKHLAALPNIAKLKQDFWAAYGQKSEGGNFAQEVGAALASGTESPAMQQVMAQISAGLGEQYVADFRRQAAAAGQDFSPADYHGGPFLLTKKAARDEEDPPAEADEGMISPQRRRHLGERFASAAERTRGQVKGMSDSHHSLQPFFQSATEAIDHAEQEFPKRQDEASAQKVQGHLEQDIEDEVQTAGRMIASDTKLSAPKTGQDYFSKLWEDTTFLSLADIGNMWDTVAEFVKRRHSRNSKLRGGRVGKALFEKSYRILGNEFDNQAESAEVEEVDNYKKSFDNKDAWDVMNRVEKCSNKDELKACLYKLSEWGRIDWRDRRIWRALERYQHIVRFLESDAGDMNALRIKLQRACGTIWDEDYFRGVDRDNNSKMKSGAEEYQNEAEANLKQLTTNLGSMIVERRRGLRVDPHRFEGYLTTAMKLGKSTPEAIMYFLIQGLHFGLLSFERVGTMDRSYLNNYPPIQWFYNNKHKLSDIRRIAEMFPPDADGFFPSNFYAFYNTNILTNHGVIERLKKAADDTNRDWDHDWMAGMGGAGDDGLAKKLMSRTSSGALNMNITGLQNMAVGQRVFITNLACNQGELSESAMRKVLARQIGYMATYSAIAHGRLKRPSTSSQPFEPLNNDALEGPPRIQDAYFHGEHSNKNLTTRQFINGNEFIIKQVSSELFSILHAPEINDSIIKAFVDFAARHHYPIKPIPKDAEEMFAHVHPLVEHILNIDPNAVNRVMDTAKHVYAKDHDGQIAENIIPYERAANWEQTYQQTLQKAYVSGNPAIYAA